MFSPIRHVVQLVVVVEELVVLIVVVELVFVVVHLISGILIQPFFA